MSSAGACLVSIWLGFLTASSSVAAPPPVFVEEDVLAVARGWAGGAVNEPSDVAMALDANGRPHLVFHVPRRAVYHARRTESGWQLEYVDSAVAVAAGQDTSLEFGTHCRIAFDGLDRAHVAYVQKRYKPVDVPSSAWKQIHYRSQTAAGFGVPWATRESTHPGIGFLNLGVELSLGVSPDGTRAHVVTNAAGSFPPVIYQERVGGLWSAPFSPAFPHTGQLQDLVVTPDGAAWISSNDGNSTGDVRVGRLQSEVWSVVLAGDSNINTNPDGRLARHGSSGDDLYLCFQARAGRVALRTRVNGEWRTLVTADDPGPVIPTFGRLRMASAPGGWTPWILSSRGTGGVGGGALLSASSTLATEQWSTIDVSNAIAMNGSTWIAVGAPNRVHVVYQVRDNSVGGTDGMQLRYAVLDGPVPPALDAAPPTAVSRNPLQLVPNIVRSGSPLSVRIVGSAGSDATLSVLDAAGREIRSRNVGTVAPAGTTLAWDVGVLESGVYWVRIRIGPYSAARRFVVLR